MGIFLAMDAESIQQVIPKLLPNQKYDPDIYPAKLLAILVNDEARSKAQCCVALGITRMTFYAWLRDHKEFKDAWEMGYEYMQKHYEDDAKKISDGDKGRNASATMHKYLMSSVLEDYRERKEIHVIDDFKNMSPQQLVMEARRRLQLLPEEKLCELGFDKEAFQHIVDRANP